MATEVVKKQATEVSTELAEWGQPEAINAKDVVIPKVLLMQKMSDLVDAGQAKEGDFVDSLTKKVVGAHDKPIEIIPFYLERLWFISKKVGTDWEIQEITPVTPANQDQRYNEIVEGVELKRELHMRFYCILPSDPSIPYVVTFKVMSQKNGRALYTQMYVKNAAAKLSPAAYVMSLKADKEANEKGKYYVFNTSVARRASKEEELTCLQWFKTIRAGQATVDNSDEAEDKPNNDTFAKETNF